MIDANAWMSKEDAAKELTTSTRTIERHIRAGSIQTLKMPRAGKSPQTLCNKRDIDALKPGAYVLPSQKPAILHPTQQSAPALRPSEVDAIREMILTEAAKLATIATPAPAPQIAPSESRAWQRVDEAAAGSGLSSRLIRSLITAGEIVAVKDGNTWKVSKQSLLEWKPSQSTTPHPKELKSGAAGRS